VRDAVIEPRLACSQIQNRGDHHTSLQAGGPSPHKHIAKKNPNHTWLGQRVQAVAPPPRKGPPAENEVGFLARGLSYSPRLPKAVASVVFADFVPLTVAGQRWLRTIFPGHDPEA
jgi:hypothetical protein